jgi:hypothetical protein
MSKYNNPEVLAKRDKTECFLFSLLWLLCLLRYWLLSPKRKILQDFLETAAAFKAVYRENSSKWA